MKQIGGKSRNIYGRKLEDEIGCLKYNKQKCNFRA